MSVAAIRADVEAGRYLHAWSAAQVLGPLASWSRTPERILAGRLAMALGAPRLGFSLHLRAHRLDPADAEALYYRARAVLALRGPYAAWRFMREREFRLTREAAHELLGRGIPFTLSTQYATSGHAQAVAGCDPLRGTLLVRDPSLPRLVEMMLEPLIEQQASHGPRCLALVPADAGAALAVPELPDEREYDALHELELSLQRHDRAQAQSIRDALHARAPTHLLSLFMDARLFAYDDDPEALLPVYDALAARFPENELYGLRRVSLLLQLGRRADAIALLRPRAQRPGADPVFATRLAEVLAEDAREEREALRLLERSLRLRPADAPALDRAAEAVGFLRERVARLGDRSSAPARSLFRGLEDLGRIDEGLEALEAALARHPGDGDLLLFVAEAQGRYGRLARARELLDVAAGRARESDRRRTEARLSRWAGDLGASLQAWSAVAAAEPLAMDAHRAVAELRSRLEGRPRAIEDVAAASARVPTHLGLRRLLVEWMRDDPAGAEAAVRALLERHPTDAWSHRELALVLSEQERFGEALEALARAAELEPEQASTLGVRGLVLARAGRAAEAAQCFRAAVERAVDYRSAVEGLIDASPGREAKQKALRFLAGELVRQRAADSFFTFQRRSHGILEPSETLASLEAARAAHPDLWQAASAVADQLTEEGRLEPAAGVLEDATRRFPLVAPLWLDRARVSGRQGDAERETLFLEKAIALSPGWTVPRGGSPRTALAMPRLSSPWYDRSRPNACKSSSRSSTRCWRSSPATRTPTTCARRCSPRPLASRRRSRRARRPRSPARRRASSSAGAPGCWPAPDAARRRWPR